MKTQIEFRDPQTLRLHKLHKQHIAEPDSESDEWHSFVDAQRAAGPDGIPPIFITAEGLIMDGGRRWLAAKLLQWPEIACIVRPEEHAAVILVESLLHSKRMTRGAVIYLALGLRKDFVESAEQRRLANLRRGIKTNENPLTGKTNEAETVKEICTRWGITDMTYGRARLIRELFHDESCKELIRFYGQTAGCRVKVPALEELRHFQTECREKLEPELLSGEKNLWNVISYIGGSLPGNQDTRDENVGQKQLEFWGDAFKPLSERAATWKKLPAAEREQVFTKWRAAVADIPQDLRKAIITILEEA